MPPDFLMEDVSSYQNYGHRVPLSADEAAIRRRGKRRIPASFSPEREADRVPAVSASPLPTRSGTAGDQSRPRLEVVRKKLFSGGDGPVQSVQADMASLAASPAKKMKTTEMSLTSPSTINNNDPISETPKKMAALSKVQLVKLVSDMTLTDPSLMEKISPLVPQVPDITGQLASLEKHGQNVFKAMPTTRLSNHHDSIRSVSF